MRELFNNILNRHYANENRLTVDQHKSLQATRGFERGFSVVDSFFQKRQGSEKRWPTCVFLLMIGGLCMISSGIIMHFYDPYDLIFKWKLQFDEGGEIFELWRNPPVSVYCKIYLFNITNAEAVMAGKEKMKVEEVGPYVYKEDFKHTKVTFNDNDTVSTIPKHPLVWQPHLSPGRSEDDVFMLPNIALLSIAQVVADKPFFVRMPINIVIRQANEQPIVRQTAKEFMFGYETTLTTLGNNLLPNWIYFEKVGLIDRMYDFEGDYETMFSGRQNTAISGLYDTYKGSIDLPNWEGEHCSRIQYASDGVKFKSFVEYNETLRFFRKSMCRPQNLVRVGEDTVVNGLAATRYEFEQNALDNGEINEKNKCFCRNGECLPRGLIDVTDCYYGFPIALSYPHFMNTDPKVSNMSEGSKPDINKHESYFMINRESGLPLKISVKLQINMAMRDVSNMAHVEHFSNTVIPTLWFEIAMERLPTHLNNRFIFYLNILPAFVQFTYYACLIGGPLMLLWSVIRASRQVGTINAQNLRNGNVYMPCEEKAIDEIVVGDSETDHCLGHSGGDSVNESDKKDNISVVSSSGISSDMSENKLSSYEATDTVELRITEENDEELNQTDPRSSLLQFNNYTKIQLGRQESHQSISVILDNI